MSALPAGRDRASAPLVSVIMANRNGEAFIGAAVRSVLDQTLSSLELILIDDHSSDFSLARAEQAAAGDPRLITVTSAVSLGPGGARNRGLAMARGRWIAIVDSDDLLEPDRLEALLRLARERRADLVADNLRLFSEAGEGGDHLPAGRWNKVRQIDLAEFARSNRFYAKGPNLGFLKPMISRGVLARSGVRYDERLRVGEDYDLVARLLASGAAYWVDPAPRYRYRRHASSTSHRLRRSDIEGLIAAEQRFRRDHPDIDRAALTALDNRRASLERALAYDAMVTALKAHAPFRALGELLKRPSAAPLLAMPLTARLARAGHALSRRGAPSPGLERRDSGFGETNRGPGHLAVTRGATASGMATVESGEIV